MSAMYFLAISDLIRLTSVFVIDKSNNDTCSAAFFSIGVVRLGDR